MRTRHLPLLLPGATLLFSAAASSQQAPTGRRLDLAASAPAPIVAVAPVPDPPAPGVCVARPRQRFHLRPQMTEASVGAELAAGTELEVLGAAPLLRLASRLWLVRERGTRREGYAFLEASDFAPSCPEPHLSADAATPPAPSPAAWLSARPAPTVEALLAPGGAAPERAQVVLAGDVDGDGTVDLLLEVQRSPERQLSQVGQVLARHTAAGWVGQLVSASHPDYASRWLTLALSASGAYAIEFFESQGESGFSEPAFVVHRYDASQSALVRAGRLEADRAAHGATGVAPAWRFQATRSGGLAVTGLRGPARGFRYEAARHQLVP